jgi:hypothetical protein
VRGKSTFTLDSGLTIFHSRGNFPLSGFVIHVQGHLPNERFIFAKNSDEQAFGIDLGHAKAGLPRSGRRTRFPSYFL